RREGIWQISRNRLFPVPSLRFLLSRGDHPSPALYFAGFRNLFYPWHGCRKPHEDILLIFHSWRRNSISKALPDDVARLPVCVWLFARQLMGFLQHQLPDFRFSS